MRHRNQAILNDWPADKCIAVDNRLKAMRAVRQCEGCPQPVGDAPQLLNQDVLLCRRCQAAPEASHNV